MKDHLDFWEAYEILNEIKIADFDKEPENGEKVYYHFFSKFIDFINSIDTGRIYSNKNNQVSQLDLFVYNKWQEYVKSEINKWEKENNTTIAKRKKDNKQREKRGEPLLPEGPNIDLLDKSNGYSYICMTTGVKGKKRTAINFLSPYGVSFTKKVLEDATSSKGYLFNSDLAYNQVENKIEYDISKKNKTPTTSKQGEPLLKQFRDFHILAIGQLADDPGTGLHRYFVSGGQGRNLANYISSKIFIGDKEGEDLYKDLYRMFKENMRGDKKHTIYWFSEDRSGNLNSLWELEEKDQNQVYNKIITKKDGTTKEIEYIINTKKQLNKDYIPWVDKKKDKNGQDTHNYAMRFEWQIKDPNIKVKEFIGVGPFKVVDENNKVILQLNMCTPGGMGGYPAPHIFGKKSTDKTYIDNDQSKPVGGQKKNNQVKLNLLLSEQSAKKLYSLYDESEYRVYIPKKQDFRFKIEEVNSFILPNAISLDNQENIFFDIKGVCDAIAENNQAMLQSIDTFLESEAEFKKVFLPYIKHKTKKLNDKNIVPIKVQAVQVLLDMLKNHPDLAVECADVVKLPKSSIPSEDDISTSEANDEVARISGKAEQSGDNDGHQRELVDVDKVYPDLAKAETVQWKGHAQSVKAPFAKDDKYKGKMARLGAEAIVLGVDENNKAYLLVVDNNQKASGFFELPGGGFYEKDHIKNNGDYEVLIKQRLKFKGGLEESDLKKDSIADTRKALIVNEQKTMTAAEKKKIEWLYSYYRLFTAYVDPERKLLDSEKLDNVHNNRKQAIDDDLIKYGENGYDCYLKWIPVSSLWSAQSIDSRYRCIIDLINERAKELQQASAEYINKINNKTDKEQDNKKVEVSEEPDTDIEELSEFWIF